MVNTNLDALKQTLNLRDKVIATQPNGDGKLVIQVDFATQQSTRTGFYFNVETRKNGSFGLTVRAAMDDEIRVIRKPVREISAYDVLLACYEIAKAIQEATFTNKNYWLAEWPKQLAGPLHVTHPQENYMD